MAKPGDVIENPRIGARMVFLRTGAETNGEVLEADLFVQPGRKAPPRHLHPNHEERFRVVSGSLTTWVSRHESALLVGEECVVPKGSVHTCGTQAIAKRRYVWNFAQQYRRKDWRQSTGSSWMAFGIRSNTRLRSGDSAGTVLFRV